DGAPSLVREVHAPFIVVIFASGSDGFAQSWCEVGLEDHGIGFALESLSWRAPSGDAGGGPGGDSTTSGPPVHGGAIRASSHAVAARESRGSRGPKSCRASGSLAIAVVKARSTNS